jgi:hypothetical protein
MIVLPSIGYTVVNLVAYPRYPYRLLAGVIMQIP